MEKLTWREICKRYPGQHLGISEIEFDTNGSDIKRAVVLYSPANATRNDILRAVSASHGSVWSVYIPGNDYLEVAATGYASV